MVAVHTLRNCLLEFVILDLQKRYSGERYWIFNATSIDYNPKNKLSIEFFKTVQNKMHYATHGQTAAEIIFYRVDSKKIIQALLILKAIIQQRVKLKSLKII